MWARPLERAIEVRKENKKYAKEDGISFHFSLAEAVWPPPFNILGDFPCILRTMTSVAKKVTIAPS